MSGCRPFFALCCMIYINIKSKQYLTSTCPNTFLCIWWRILIHLFNRRLTLPLHVLHRHQKWFTIDRTHCNSPLYPGFLTTSEKKLLWASWLHVKCLSCDVDACMVQIISIVLYIKKVIIENMKYQYTIVDTNRISLFALESCNSVQHHPRAKMKTAVSCCLLE